MMKVYGFGSPNVLKVLIALEELGVAYDLEIVDVFEGDQYAEAFGALTLNRKVPVLVDEDGPGGAPITLWESGAILLYLAEKHGRFMPTDPRARAIAMQWLMWQMAGVGPMMGQLSHFTIYAPQSEHHYARARYASETKRLYDVAEMRLQKNPFLSGADYSIVDMATWPWLQRASARGVDLSDLPATARWVQTIAARPAVQTALQRFEPMTHVDVPQQMLDRPDAVDRYGLRGRYSRI